MMRPSRPAEPILLVEGQDDKHIVWQICRRNTASFAATRQDYAMRVALLSAGTEFLIDDRGSRSEVISAIRQEATTRRRAMGVLIDADADPTQCWKELATGFSRTTISFPNTPDPAGVIIPEQPGTPRIGVWMMPDNQSPGELEDFVKRMIPPTAPVWPEAQRYIDNIPPGIRKFAPDKTDKAKLYAWLATLKEPARMGAAIGNGDLQTNNRLCQTFLLWLQRLFS